MRTTLTMDWRGRTLECEVKLHLFPTVRRNESKITMDWRGRTRGREVQLQTRATLILGLGFRA